MKRIIMSMLAIVMLATCMCTSVNAQAYRLRQLGQRAVNAAASRISEKTVSIDAIPQTVEQFIELQNRIAVDPEGAVMMVIVSMEVYRQNKQVGEECVRLANVDVNFNSMIRRVREIYNTEDQYYGRPYQAACFFKGATPRNGYNPDKPYTIRVRTNPTQREDERSQSLRGYVKHLQVHSNGFDTEWRGCDVVKQKGCDIYKVSNCPSLYTQCKEIDFESDREYEGM